MELTWRKSSQTLYGYDNGDLVAYSAPNKYVFTTNLMIGICKGCPYEYIVKFPVSHPTPDNTMKNIMEKLYGIAKQHKDQESALAAINVYIKLRGPEWYLK